MHDSIRNRLKICLIESFLNHEVVLILVEVEVEHEVRGEQIVHESYVCQVMRESLKSSQKHPSNLLRISSREILAISRLVLTFINEDILLMPLYHVVKIIIEEQPVKLFLIERMHETEVLFDFLGVHYLNEAEFVEFLINRAHKRGIHSEVILDSVPEKLNFVNIHRFLQIDQKGTLLVPFAAVGIIFFVISKYFIFSEWFQLRLVVKTTESIRSGINLSR